MNKRKVTLIFLTVCIFIMIVIGSTYSWWILYRTQEDRNVLIGECLNVEFADATDKKGINLVNTHPMTSEDALKLNENVYSFKVINRCNKNQDYIIGLMDITDSLDKFSYSSISVSLDGNIIGPLSNIDNTDSPIGGRTAKLLSYGSLKPNGTNTHEFRIWVNETSGNDEINHVFDSKLFVTVGQNPDGGLIENKNLASLIKRDADTETVINFNVPSRVSGTNGIFTTTNTDSGKEVYYYRGQVDNNLIFANSCWKIIRTTETGGVKIIYNGTASEDGSCLGEEPSVAYSRFSNTWGMNSDIAYMIAGDDRSTYATTHSNVKDSTVKTAVDNWYEENIENKDFSKYIEDAVYCNDRNMVAGGSVNNNVLSPTFEVYGYKDKPTGYGTLARSSYWTINANPSLVCKNTTGFVPEDNDAFTVTDELGNGKLKYPVGLITSDELVYAGFNTKGDKSNTTDNNYLASGTYYWTMSPSATGYTALMTNNSLSYSAVQYENDVRPVVSLKPGILIESGDGTVSNPYIIKY